MRGRACSRQCCSCMFLVFSVLLGLWSYSAVESARDYTAAQIYLDNCRDLGQSPGGACGWTCVEVGGVCEWCTSPPSVLAKEVNRTCVGNPKGPSQPSWYPLPPTSSGQCGQTTRSASCSQCQYNAGNATAAILACAGAASFVAAAILGGCCSTCGAFCGAACCSSLCLCCGVTLGGGSLYLGVGGVLVFTGDCCREGCKCCGRECLPPSTWAPKDMPGVLSPQANSESLLAREEKEMNF